MKRIRKKVKSTLVLILMVSFISIGCQSKAPAPMAPTFSNKDLNEQLVMATLWMQTAAEYRALCYQSFNLARMNLDSFLDSYKGDKPVAIIVDADEAVIDNSAYEAFLIGQNSGYSSKTWVPWMNAAEAKAIPGAGEFLQYANSKGVETFYITNRKMVGYEGTKTNLEALGFPDVDKKHLLLRTKSSNKQARRDIVLKDYAVALYMGDNLNDFESGFAKKSVEQRFALTDEVKEAWGTKYIVLPNPSYGEWEAAVIGGNFRASAAEKDKMRKDHLIRWNKKP